MSKFHRKTYSESFKLESSQRLLCKWFVNEFYCEKIGG